MAALLIIFLILTILMLLPLGIDGGYSDRGLVVGIKAGPFNLRMIPTKKRHTKVKKASKKQRKPKKQKGKKPKAPMSKKELISLIKLGLKALKRFGKRLSVDYLRIHVEYATDDPFDTAIGFGAANAALGTLFPLIDSVMDIKEPDFYLGCSFTRDKTAVDVWITVTIRVGQLLFVAMAFGTDFIMQKIKNKIKIRNIERNEANGKTSDRRPDRSNLSKNQGNG